MLCCLLTTSLQPCQATKKPSGRIACVDEAALVPVPWVALQGLRVQVTQA